MGEGVMKPYPIVTGELDTLRQVVAGASIARYGDGEFSMCKGAACKSQEANHELTRRLNAILKSSGDALVGIPNIHPSIETPKRSAWNKYLWASSLLSDRPYVSSFITRPDSAPWIDSPEYWSLLEQLWIGKDITLVRGSDKSLVASDLVGAGTVTEVISTPQSAWKDYAKLMKEIGTPTTAILCLGPTATVMAVDLAAKGVHAVDIGHVGGFLRKHRRGEPMWLPKDKPETDQRKAGAA